MEPNIFRYIWKHSRREQLMILALILCSLPFYWMSLDVPKRIVNEALQGKAFADGQITARLFEVTLSLPSFLGGGSYKISEGVDFERLGYLLALSFLFLFFVVCNGGFKLAINLSKGMLAERMLRRMRFELFARLMRFQPEEIKSVKPAEAASMINNEIEPVGGFIGDAFIQPVFLGTQAATALIFIMVQSVWLGLVAFTIVLAQAIIIPYLRREQVRLGRERQIASRRLAGRIGELVDGASLVHSHGLQRYSLAEIGSRLGTLFDIRARLYKRKFAVKFLNNFLAQITPFFFFAVGGYLALRGSLDIGQLVAVIAAYRDLPPPIKELIDWDQMRADATVKYEQVVLQLSSQGLIRGDEDGSGAAFDATPAIALEGVRVSDYRGAPLLHDTSLAIPPGSHVALVGTPASGRDLVARVIGRQITRYEGRALFDGHDVRTLSDAEISPLLAYAPPEPVLIGGSIRDNITIALRRSVPPPGRTAEIRWREAERTGNPLYPDDADWQDYAAAGVGSADELDARILELLAMTGMSADLYAFGLQGMLEPGIDDAMIARLLDARDAIRARLSARKLDRLVAPFEFESFNRQKTIGENLVFGVVTGQRLSARGLEHDRYFQRIIGAEGLEPRLTEIGVRIAENSVEVFAGLPSDHPLLERFSMIKAQELEDYARIVATARARRADIRLRREDRNRLIALALAYVEPRHRLGLVDERLEARVLRARWSFRHYLPEDYAREIEFYDAGVILRGAPIRDNLLFGRVAQDVANAEQRVAAFLHETLEELGLESYIFARGLDFDVGPGGRNLFGPQRAAINLARGLVGRPHIFVVEGALSAFNSEEQRRVLDALHEELKGRTLVVTAADREAVTGCDMVVQFDAGRARVTAGGATGRAGASDGNGGAGGPTKARVGASSEESQ